MSHPYDQFVHVLTRIAQATSIKRVMTEDEIRFQRNGGPTAELIERVTAELPKLEAIARRLEADL